MYKFMLCTFAFLAWGFWELSGGSEFEPPEMRDDTEQVLATFDVDTSNGPTQVVSEDGAVVQPSATVVDATLTDADGSGEATGDDATAALTSGISAIEAETFTPTTSSAISVEAVAPTTTVAAAQVDLRRVAGSRVNMRNGPSTDFQVLDQLVRNTEVEVIDNDGTGWVQLRVVESGRVGWMAERLLTRVEN